MCLTYYQINYCGKCISYIKTYVLGTSFCDDQRENKACETQIQFQEMRCPGPCAACRQPAEVIRRSQRIRSMGVDIDYSEECEDDEEGDEEDQGTEQEADQEAETE